jgi:hypothetical protein
VAPLSLFFNKAFMAQNFSFLSLVPLRPAVAGLWRDWPVGAAELRMDVRNNRAHLLAGVKNNPKIAIHSR